MTQSPGRTYRTDSAKAAPDGRFFSPSYERNIAPVTAALTKLTTGMSGAMLEIGSGTGQHAADLSNALPHLQITPSDPDPEHRASINAWRAYNAPNLNPAIALDASANWAKGMDQISVILSMNVIHISPPEVATGILRGAAQALQPGGLLILYGPFKEDGRHTGDGNVKFDAFLQAQNPNWGIRDIGDITDQAAQFGLRGLEILPMPANNRIVVFRP